MRFLVNLFPPTSLIRRLKPFRLWLCNRLDILDNPLKWQASLVSMRPQKGFLLFWWDQDNLCETTEALTKSFPFPLKGNLQQKQRCCYMAYNLLHFHAVFFQLFIFQCSMFQRFQPFNGRYFQHACILATIFNLHEGGSSLHNMPGPHDGFALPAASAFPIVSHEYFIQTKKITVLLNTFTLKQLYSCTVYSNSLNIKPLKYVCIVFKIWTIIHRNIESWMPCRCTKTNI
jgi:hypothetical protein